MYFVVFCLRSAICRASVFLSLFFLKVREVLLIFSIYYQQKWLRLVIRIISKLCSGVPFNRVRSFQRARKVCRSSQLDVDGHSPAMWTWTQLAGCPTSRELEIKTLQWSNVVAEGRTSRGSRWSTWMGTIPLWNINPTSLNSYGERLRGKK